MNLRMLALLAAVLAAVAFVCVGGIMIVAGGTSACSPPPAPSGAPTSATSSAASGVAGRYDAEQLHNASVIISVGVRRGVPARGHIIAVATAMQESGLRNLPHLGERNDHDSVGLFQQRPSQGWGTAEQILDPEYATGRFYDKLLTIDGWQLMPLTQAAQRVQDSAYPNAFAKHEADATVIVAMLSGGVSTSASNGVQGCGGWMKPVAGRIVSGYGLRGEGDSAAMHYGVDIPAAKRTPIRVAASGVVLRAECNAHLADGRTYSCDVDGNPSTVRGCGWFADVQHTDRTVTRYCHMESRPMVEKGQTVVVGQVIGLVGSSGHSSGPHLHLETHLDAPATQRNAINPVDYFRERLVDLSN